MNKIVRFWRSKGAQTVFAVFVGGMLVFQTYAPAVTYAQDTEVQQQVDLNQNEDESSNEERSSLVSIPDPKVQICHKEGNGSYHEIEISWIAWITAHLFHGDIYPVPQNGCPQPKVDLEMKKSIDGNEDEFAIGDTLTYKLSVKNDSNADATGVVVNDNLPTQVTYVSSNASDGTYDSGTGLWTIGDLDAGDTATLTITVTVNGTAIVGHDVENTATASSSNGETQNDLRDNRDDTEFEVKKAKINPLVLTSICSSDPATLKNWQVTNPNPVAVNFSWKLLPSGSSTNSSVPANSSVTFLTNAQGTNDVRIEWKNENNQNKNTHLVSTTTLCPKDLQPCGAELIENGSFETPAINQSWNIVNNNTPGLGWFVQWLPVVPGSAPTPASVELHRGVNGWLSQAGQQYAELDGDWGGPSSNQSGEDGSTKVYQHLPTEAGHKYTISFWTSPRPGVADNKVRFSWDGNVEATISENGTGKTQTEWTQHTYTLTATGAMTTIEFADLSVGDSLGSFLDNVSVTEVCISDVNLTGTKFNDIDGDGVQDPGENGLAGWTIYAYDGANGLASNITVDSEDIDGSDTNWVAPGEYIIMARGTWTNRNDANEQFDADYYTLNNWGSHTDGTTGYGGAGPNEGDLMIDNAFPNWGPYNDLDSGGFKHYYYLPYTHDGGNINFSIFDGDVNTGVKNPGWYGDNEGTINVQMYRVLGTAVTDSNGNYEMNFTTTPGSTVTVGEFQQNGWIQTFPTAPGTHTFVTENGDNEISDKDFGNHEDISCDRVINQNDNQDLRVQLDDSFVPCISTISGTKFNDKDGNGERGESEEGLEGWKVYAYNGIPSSNVTVNSAVSTGTDTNAVAAGKYLIMARGTWQNGGGSHYFDTEFHTTDSWATHEDGEVGVGPDNGDLLINGSFANWGVYNDQNENGFEHYYFMIYDHVGGNINYSVFDGTGGVKNPGWYGDNNGSINVQMYQLLDETVTDSNGDYTLEIDTNNPVTVVVREVQQAGWVQTSPNSSTGTYALNGLIEGVNYPITGNWNLIFGIGNREVADKDFGNMRQTIKVLADKIVCEDESYLPNWGAGQNGSPSVINSQTATDFVNNSEGKCHFQYGWSFQWGHNDKSDGDDGTIEGVDMTKGTHTGEASVAGDSTGLCGDPYCGENTETGTQYNEWQGFDSSTSGGPILYAAKTAEIDEIPDPVYGPAMVTISDLDGSDRIWVREKLQEGYVPFSSPEGGFPGSDVSAEIYCHDDIANYDNYDYISNPQMGSTYYCVAFNAPKNETIITGTKYDQHENGLENWTIYAAKQVTSVEVSAQGTGEGGNDLPVATIDDEDLVENEKYLLKVNGTFTAGDNIDADAKFSQKDSSGTWTDLVEDYESYGPELLDLQVSNDGGTVFDSFLTDPYNSTHTYWHDFTYTSGNDLAFRIYDIYPSNNSGSITVTLYHVIEEDQTDADGHYALDLTGYEGDVIIMEQHQSLWSQFSPNNDGQQYYNVNLSGEFKQSGYDFGNERLCSNRETKPSTNQILTDNNEYEVYYCNSIRGYKWNDVNGNREWDQQYTIPGDEEEDISEVIVPAEPVIGGVTVYLDMNNNNTFDEGEPYDITDENGYYSFNNLPTGNYTVREVVPYSYYQTYPYSPTDYEYEVLVNNNDNSGYNFGNKQRCLVPDVIQATDTLQIVDQSEEEDDCIDAVDPAVVKTVDDGTPIIGETIVYTIVVTNNSDITATGIDVMDTIPSGVTYVSDDSALTSTTYSSVTHLWTIPSLAAGASVTLHITGVVAEGASGTITNTATVVGSDLGDTDLSNNSDSADIVVRASGGGGCSQNCGGGGGSTGGGGTPSGDQPGGGTGEGTPGRVLGDTTPVTMPQVLGATELPRTGTDAGIIILSLMFGALQLGFSRRKN